MTVSKHCSSLSILNLFTCKSQNYGTKELLKTTTSSLLHGYGHGHLQNRQSDDTHTAHGITQRSPNSHIATDVSFSQQLHYAGFLANLTSCCYLESTVVPLPFAQLLKPPRYLCAAVISCVHVSRYLQQGCNFQLDVRTIRTDRQTKMQSQLASAGLAQASLN